MITPVAAAYGKGSLLPLVASVIVPSTGTVWNIGADAFPLVAHKVLEALSAV